MFPAPSSNTGNGRLRLMSPGSKGIIGFEEGGSDDNRTE